MAHASALCASQQRQAHCLALLLFCTRPAAYAVLCCALWFWWLKPTSCMQSHSMPHMPYPYQLYRVLCPGWLYSDATLKAQCCSALWHTAVVQHWMSTLLEGRCKSRLQTQNATKARPPAVDLGCCNYRHQHCGPCRYDARSNRPALSWQTCPKHCHRCAHLCWPFCCRC